MGQKANPVGLRLKINRTWESNWYAEKDYGSLLVEDLRIRRYIQKKIFRSKNYSKVEISDIRIKRFPGQVNIYIYTSRPGLLIGKKGQDIDDLRKQLQDLVRPKGLVAPTELKINININEVKKVDLDAKIVAQNVGRAIEGRMAYKRAMKQAIARTMKSGAKGIKIQVSGRLGGSDIARREFFREGSIPLHTFRAAIDHGKYDAITTYGVVGIQTWIFKGEGDRAEGSTLESPGALVNKRQPTND